MKIILTDNYDRDDVGDVLLAENINLYWGRIIVDILNAKFGGENSATYFLMVTDSHKLKEDFVP